MVEPVDPLFLTPGCRFYLPPNEKEPKKGGAWCTLREDGPGQVLRRRRTGAKHLERLKDADALQAPARTRR